MNEPTDKAALTPEAIYSAYPDHDLLPIEPPKPGETIEQFAVRAEEAGDTLFLFLCREADDEIDLDEYRKRLDRAIEDLQTVRDVMSSHALDCSVHPHA